MRKEHLPFTYLNIVRRLLDRKGRSILDVGCGRGELMEIINKNRKFFAVGIDGFFPYLKVCKERRVFNGLLLSDVRSLPFRKKSFDVVFCSQAVEHLFKREGKKLMDDLEQIAKRQVILGTTVGFFPHEPFEGKDENPLQVHKSGWRPDEFRKRGYKVYGQGAGFVYGKNKNIKRLPGILRIPFFVLSYFLSPIFYFFPDLAAYIICVKKIK